MANYIKQISDRNEVILSVEVIEILTQADYDVIVASFHSDYNDGESLSIIIVDASQTRSIVSDDEDLLNIGASAVESVNQVDTGRVLTNTSTDA